MKNHPITPFFFLLLIVVVMIVQINYYLDFASVFKYGTMYQTITVSAILVNLLGVLLCIFSAKLRLTVILGFILGYATVTYFIIEYIKEEIPMESVSVFLFSVLDQVANYPHIGQILISTSAILALSVALLAFVNYFTNNALTASCTDHYEEINDRDNEEMEDESDSSQFVNYVYIRKLDVNKFKVVILHYGNPVLQLVENLTLEDLVERFFSDSYLWIPMESTENYIIPSFTDCKVYEEEIVDALYELGMLENDE